MKYIISIIVIFMWFSVPAICRADSKERIQPLAKPKIEVPEKIETYLIKKLGLSSTGKIQVIGKYNLTDDCKLGKKQDEIIHVIQKDLLGGRLVWSCLVNLTQGRVQVLYRCQNSDSFGKILIINEKIPN